MTAPDSAIAATKPAYLCFIENSLSLWSRPLVADDPERRTFFLFPDQFVSENLALIIHQPEIGFLMTVQQDFHFPWPRIDFRILEGRLVFHHVTTGACPALDDMKLGPVPI